MSPQDRKDLHRRRALLAVHMGNAETTTCLPRAAAPRHTFRDTWLWLVVVAAVLFLCFWARFQQ